jgi:uncharacterized membrane protein YhaH (DUF805 family)
VWIIVSPFCDPDPAMLHTPSRTVSTGQFIRLSLALTVLNNLVQNAAIWGPAVVPGVLVLPWMGLMGLAILAVIWAAVELTRRRLADAGLWPLIALPAAVFWFFATDALGILSLAQAAWAEAMRLISPGQDGGSVDQLMSLMVQPAISATVVLAWVWLALRPSQAGPAADQSWPHKA